MFLFLTQYKHQIYFTKRTKNPSFRPPGGKKKLVTHTTSGSGFQGGDLCQGAYSQSLSFPRKSNPPPSRVRGRRGDEARRRPTLPHCGAVPSARAGLTSLFGMGRGGAPPLGPPCVWRRTMTGDTERTRAADTPQGAARRPPLAAGAMGQLVSLG